MASSASSPRVGTQWNVQTSYTGGYVSPATLHNRPDVNKRIFDYDESSVYDFLIHAGRTKVTGNKEYFHAEFDSRWHTHTVESKSGSAGAGNKATITLEEVDHLDDATSGNLSAPQEGDQGIAYTASGPIKFYVTDVNKATPDAHTVELDPQDDTVDLVTAIAAADKVIIYSNAYGDGTDMPYPTARLPITYSNYVQIFKSMKKTDGQQSAHESYFDTDGSPYYYHQLVKDGYYEARAKMENAFILGFKNYKPDPRDTTKDAYQTGGLEWYADTYGYLEPYSTSFGLSDLENVRKCLDIEKQPAKQLFLVGSDLNAQVDEFIGDKNLNTAVNWAQMGVGSAAGRMFDFGVDGFRYGTFTFMKQKFNLFNEQGLTGGITGSPYPGMGFTLPWAVYKDASTGKDLDSVCLRTMQNDRGSRYMDFWIRDKKTTNIDAIEFNHQCEAGLEIGFPRWICKVAAA